MQFEIEDYIDQFTQIHLKPFTVKEVQNLLAPSIRVSKSVIEELLYLHPNVYEYQKNTYISRAGFFSAKHFCITPSISEINAHILIIGHRCMPFVDPNIQPDELVFIYNGNPIPKKTTMVNTQEAYAHYALFGEEYAAQYFAIDNANSNCDFMKNDYILPSSISLTVLDMSSLYTDFQVHDSLDACVLNWKSGIVELKRQAKPAQNPFAQNQSRLEWNTHFANCLDLALKTNGPSESIDEQLVQTYLIGRDFLFVQNCGTVEEFLKKTEQFDFAEYGVETRLWYANKNIPLFGSWNKDIRHDSPLQTFFSNGQLPFIDSVLDAFIYDSLYKKESECALLIERLLPVDFVIPPKQFEEFLLHLNLRRDILLQTYNWFADYKTGSLRTQILELYSSMVDFICKLDFSHACLENLPPQPLIILMQLHAHILYALDSLEHDNLQDESDFLELNYSLEGMKDSFEEVKEDLEPILEDTKRDGFSLVNKKGDKNE